MPDSQRCVAIFKWDAPLPGFDVESDPERLTALTARAPAEAIVAALRAGGFQTDVDAPYGGEGGWHFTVRIDGVTFGIFTLWTGIGGQDSFAVQLDVKRGVFAALFRKPILDGRLEPACRVVDDALANVPRVKELRWLTDAEFEQSYCRGRPLLPTEDARQGEARGVG